MTKKSIHIELDKETYQQWLTICEVFKGNTKTAVFRNIVKRIHASLEDALKTNAYE